MHVIFDQIGLESAMQTKWEVIAARWIQYPDQVELANFAHDVNV